MSRLSSRVLFTAYFLFLIASIARGQTATSVNNSETKPIPGAGHNYVKFLAETVNPADGSLDVSISLPAPASRGLSFPFI